MNFRTRLTFTSLSFTAALLLGMLTSASVAAAPYTTELACCDSAADPSSCFIPVSANDLTECDAEAETAMCDLDDGVPYACDPVDLQCCPVIDGVTLMEYCGDFEPGIACAGTVIATPTPELGYCCWCRGPYEVCEVDLSESCENGGAFGPLVCEDLYSCCSCDAENVLTCVVENEYGECPDGTDYDVDQC
jgi:hypothetical protein